MALVLNRPSEPNSAFSINPLTIIELNIHHELHSPVLKKGFVFVPILGFYNDRRHLADNLIEQINKGNAAWKDSVEKEYVGGVWLQFFYHPIKPSAVDDAIKFVNIYAE
ncbi:hypothetical protein P168DRAFT_284888 [Aspergillus campestris IBT 28561]|uniref:Uncharacterized protein n=1 Tax=Aspergillus campestris (strain IBT 28561) TaxID=1392248 RepID=A0A2I1CSV9_ASPC2|nr:uncharacterized protein P168DRAFT_284888 [Aspergillus campestris IBT 28561]PKY00716.1 hypothetical protein P168DRAFT_284888 [Aspergillus campestris IBT 28561]